MAKRQTLSQLEERIQRQKKLIRQDEEQIEKLRERIRISQQSLQTMETDLRAMKYEQLAERMRENNIEVTDDMIDDFVAFAIKRQDGTSSGGSASQEEPLPEVSAPAQDSREDGGENASRITSASVNRVSWGTP